MKYNLNIALDYDISTGKVNLNEIVYRLKELQDSLMLSILEKILESYDGLISERLSKRYPSKARHGLGQPSRPVGTSGGVIPVVDFVTIKFANVATERRRGEYPGYSVLLNFVLEVLNPANVALASARC